MHTAFGGGVCLWLPYICDCPILSLCDCVFFFLRNEEISGPISIFIFSFSGFIILGYNFMFMLLHMQVSEVSLRRS